MAATLFPRTFVALEQHAEAPPNPDRICPQRSEIVELMTDIEKHPDKCLDFPLSFVSAVRATWHQGGDEWSKGFQLLWLQTSIQLAMEMSLNPFFPFDLVQCFWRKWREQTKTFSIYMYITCSIRVAYIVMALVLLFRGTCAIHNG